MTCEVVCGTFTVESPKLRDDQPAVKLRWTFDNFKNSIAKTHHWFGSPWISDEEIGLAGQDTWRLRFLHISPDANPILIGIERDAQQKQQQKEENESRKQCDITYECWISSENPHVKLEQIQGTFETTTHQLPHIKLFVNTNETPSELWTADRMIVDVRLTFPDRSWFLSALPKIKFPVAKMSKYYQSASMTDAVLISSDRREIKCHRTVLAAHSDVFEAMFQHNTKERRTGICEVEDVEYGTLKVLVDTMYGVEDGGDWSAIVDQVFVAADEYQMLGLKDKCAKHLQTSITVKNAVERFVFAKEKEVTGLAEKVVEFVGANYEEFVQSGGVQEMAGYKKELCLEFFLLLPKSIARGAKTTADTSDL